jgi:hypothetical protein
MFFVLTVCAHLTFLVDTNLIVYSLYRLVHKELKFLEFLDYLL